MFPSKQTEYFRHICFHHFFMPPSFATREVKLLCHSASKISVRIQTANNLHFALSVNLSHFASEILLVAIRFMYSGSVIALWYKFARSLFFFSLFFSHLWCHPFWFVFILHSSFKKTTLEDYRVYSYSEMKDNEEVQSCPKASKSVGPSVNVTLLQCHHTSYGARFWIQLKCDPVVWVARS